MTRWITRFLTGLAAGIVALLLAGCETTTSSTAQPDASEVAVRAEMFDPNIPLDAEYADLDEEAQKKAVVFKEGSEVPDQAPYPLGGWQSVHSNLTLPARGEATPESGEVEVEFTLGPQGTVEEATILTGFSEEVDAAVLEAFLRTPFQPAVKDGVPTRVRLRNRVTIAYNDY